MNHKPFVTTELKPLPDAVQEIIAERDEWKARCEFSFEQRDKLNAQLKTLQYEVDAIPAIKAERDQFEIAMRGWMAANALGGWIDDLRKERDEYAACADTMAAAHKVERDALKDAARLALSVLNVYDAEEIKVGREAIAALKAVLK